LNARLTSPTHFTGLNLLTTFDIQNARGNDWPVNRYACVIQRQ
jgi:hypothetical protein